MEIFYDILFDVFVLACLLLVIWSNRGRSQEIEELRRTIQSHNGQLRNIEVFRVDRDRIINQHNERISESAREVTLLNANLTSALKRLDLHDGASGGFWKTQTGHRMRVKDMSTNHLQNTLKMFAARKHMDPFIGMARELEHRKEDAEWQSKTDKMDAWREAKNRDNAVKAECDKQSSRAVSEQKLVSALRDFINGDGQS